ncbi:MAG: hypothetical protein ACKV2T_06515 [Kofleriaceae bacterium]
MRALLIAACAACGSNGSDPALDAGPDADATTTDLYDPAMLYDLAALHDPSSLAIQFGLDQTTEVQPARFVREIRFGYLAGSGFPQPASEIGASPRMFVETNATGTPLGTVDAIAIAIHNVTAVPEYGVRCALDTGVICVVAGNVATPSQISPAYPSEFGAGAITDSNQLWFNLLGEMRRGTDVDGRALAAPAVRRAYDTYIAEHAMRAITASQEVARQRFGASSPRFVITGHSKWGAAAGQVAAVDDRVVGALVMGFPLDFARFVDLADLRWRGELGIDLISVVCPPERPCAWSSIRELSAFFKATPLAPEICGGAPCAGTGDEWSRQLDLRRLIAGGHFAGKRLAMIRNGEEAHAVDTETPGFGAGQAPDQFLFLPGVGHVFDTPQHAALWRHWIRHVLGGRPTMSASSTVTTNGVTIEVSTAVAGATVTQAVLFARDSTDGTYGELDKVPGYTPTQDWRMSPCEVEIGVVRASATRSGTSTAVVMLLEIDDGSGDRAMISTPVTIVKMKTDEVDQPNASAKRTKDRPRTVGWPRVFHPGLSIVDKAVTEAHAGRALRGFSRRRTSSPQLVGCARVGSAREHAAVPR